MAIIKFNKYFKVKMGCSGSDSGSKFGFFKAEQADAYYFIDEEGIEFQD